MAQVEHRGELATQDEGWFTTMRAFGLILVCMNLFLLSMLGSSPL